MLLAKATSYKVNYTIPGLTPPSALSWRSYDPSGTQLETAPITCPSSITVSSLAALVADEEYELTVQSVPATWVVGAMLRLSDSYGVLHECLIFGINSSNKKVRVCDLNLTAGDTVTAAWCPEVTIPLTATSTPECADGYKMVVTGTTTDGWSDTLWYGVVPAAIRLDLTTRDYFDYFPEATSNLATLTKRRDWSRLLRSAQGMVEERLRGRDRYYALLVPANGIKRALASALNVLLAQSTIPAGYSAQPQIYIDQCNARYNQAVTDLLAASYYDEDQTGTVDETEKNPGLGISYKVL